MAVAVNTQQIVENWWWHRLHQNVDEVRSLVVVNIRYTLIEEGVLRLISQDLSSYLEFDLKISEIFADRIGYLISYESCDAEKVTAKFSTFISKKVDGQDQLWQINEQCVFTFARDLIASVEVNRTTKADSEAFAQFNASQHAPIR